MECATAKRMDSSLSTTAAGRTGQDFTRNPDQGHARSDYAHALSPEPSEALKASKDTNSPDSVRRRAALSALEKAYDAVAPEEAVLLGNIVALENRYAVAQGYANADRLPPSASSVAC